MAQDRIFQEVDLTNVLHEIRSKNKTLQAKLLAEMEKHIQDKEEFLQLRKYILDETNTYTRSVVRIIFGDIELMRP